MLAVLLTLGVLVVLTNPNRAAVAGNGGTASTLQGKTDTGIPMQPEFIQKLQAQATVAPLKDGRQTLDLLVNGTTMSYSPGVIQVQRGMPVRLNLQITGADPGCGRVVSLQLLGATATAAPGEVVPLDFTPREAGVFQINCNMHMMEPGYLIVTD
jgi:plastocyanin domain-containing protein